jgi:hypothetical protein
MSPKPGVRWTGSGTWVRIMYRDALKSVQSHSPGLGHGCCLFKAHAAGSSEQGGIFSHTTAGAVGCVASSPMPAAGSRTIIIREGRCSTNFGPPKGECAAKATIFSCSATAARPRRRPRKGPRRRAVFRPSCPRTKSRGASAPGVRRTNRGAGPRPLRFSTPP